MIHSVGIDLHEGRHQVRCLDAGAQLCNTFSIEPTPQGFAVLEERIFRDGSNPTMVFEPTGLVWLVLAVYLRARHPECRLVKAKGQKVAALRRYLRGPAKSDRIDALTLAKMPFIDAEQLVQVYLPPAQVHALQRLTRQRHRLGGEITARKVRIGSITDGYLPGVRQAFSDPWSPQARAFLRSQFNPWSVIRNGEKALHHFLTKARSRGSGDMAESGRVYLACENAVTLYELSRPAGTLTEEFFVDLRSSGGDQARATTDGGRRSCRRCPGPAH